ncbi:potassium channel family protein [Frondihabitans australicus]|uniref:Voltage-gated potassium channel n=1 Tax=Frondihabitans australicus TaxID=386892 RepID=A0A495IK37_9MICO|nr:potassium channel family protein [Frondihabitans australicus]RKR76159.1 voltage-gated potassium channel [Frondihabitans australicus]
MDQARWRKISDVPLMVVSVVFLAAYSIEVIANLQGHASDGVEVIIAITWLLFVIDYVVNLVLAERRGRWFWRHLLDLAIVALPLLRPLRLLRLVTLLAILQRTAGRTFRGRVVVYVVGSAALLVYVSALAVLDVERPLHGATIVNFPDALWWAFVTITTVGYGDYTPISLEGRMIAVALMLGGIALLGSVTATLASWIVERVQITEDSSQAATRGDLRRLSEQVDELKAMLAARDESPSREVDKG